MAKGFVWALVASLAFSTSQLTNAQEDEAEKKKSVENYLDVYYHDPAEFEGLWLDAQRRRHLVGPVGLRGYYTPPSQEPGPYYGPPLQIWGRGSGTSLWRNPVTGWAIQ